MTATEIEALRMRRFAAALLATVLAVGCSPGEDPDVIEEAVQGLCREMERSIEAQERDLTIDSDVGRQFEELWSVTKLEGEGFPELDERLEAACSETWNDELEVAGETVTYRLLAAGFAVVRDGCEAVPSGLVSACD